MAYDDEQARRSRVVVETPTARREVTHTEAVRNDRGGVSGTTVGVIVVVAVALITVVVLFLMNGQTPNDTANANLATTQPAAQQPVIIQQPAQQQQPPVIIQQPAPVGQQPVIIQQAPSGGTTTTSGSNDGGIQLAIDKKLLDDPELSTLGVVATVIDGKVTITGTVKSDALKSKIERTVRAVQGVKQVDNQIIVMA